MSARTDVLLWAQRVVGRKGALPHQILEIAASSGVDVAQEAFHKVAKMAHPDLHRTTLAPDELELVTTAYARAAAAYQEIRSQKKATTRLSPFRDPGSNPALVPTTTVIPTSASPNKAVSIPDGPPGNDPQAMTSKALIHYRKAELCLRRGELRAAVLHLKMAIASDPQSAFLRTALAEVQAEVGKKP
jgi:hypothetical protein